MVRLGNPSQFMPFRFVLAIALLLSPIPMLAQTPTPSPKTESTPARAPKHYTIEQFMDTVRVGGSSFTKDESAILFHSNKTGIFNVFSLPVGGGEPKQLTTSTKESTYLISASPADDQFFYTYDKGGNENSHIYIREKDGAERDLTPGDKVKANFLRWSQDRKSFFFSKNERDPKFFDIYEMPLADLKPQLIYQNEKGFEFADISNDRK